MKPAFGLALIAVCASIFVSGSSATMPGYNGLIAFSSARPASSGPRDIWAIAADGSHQINLTRTPQAENIDPAWSRDGTKVAFARRSGFDYGIWIMSADGSDQRQLTSGYTDEKPAWAPDGTKIVFQSTRQDSGTQLWVMNSDGSNLTQLTDYSKTQNGAGRNPDWSPHGAQIVFDDGRDVYVMNPEGTNVFPLTPGTESAGDFNPSFSPDGSSLVFMSDRAEVLHYEIWVMSSTGADPRRIMTPGASADPVWSPDGTQIAFVKILLSTNFQLWVMNADGSGQRQVLEGSGPEDRSPSWQARATPLPGSPPPVQPPPSVRCHVPNVLGRTLARAKTAIRSRHCKVGRITRKPSRAAKKGKVVAQSPKAGTFRASGAKVSLKVGKGRR